MQEIPAELRDFILRHLDSVAQLEALLLMRGDAQRHWTAAELAARLYISPERAEPLLQRMRRDGFAEASGDKYHYNGGSDDQRQLIDGVASFYATHLVAVTNLIHSRPSRIREFASAFKLKED